MMCKNAYDGKVWTGLSMVQGAESKEGGEMLRKWTQPSSVTGKQNHCWEMGAMPLAGHLPWCRGLNGMERRTCNNNKMSSVI